MKAFYCKFPSNCASKKFENPLKIDKVIKFGVPLFRAQCSLILFRANDLKNLEILARAQRV